MFEGNHNKTGIPSDSTLYCQDFVAIYGETTMIAERKEVFYTAIVSQYREGKRNLFHSNFCPVYTFDVHCVAECGGGGIYQYIIIDQIIAYLK